MSHSWLLVYLYKVLWNWAGILLAVDGFVALTERYLGEFAERILKRKLRTPSKYKLGFAVIVLVIAQALAYRDQQDSLAEANKNNDGLHAAINERDKRINTPPQSQVKAVRSSPCFHPLRFSQKREQGRYPYSRRVTIPIEGLAAKSRHIRIYGTAPLGWDSSVQPQFNSVAFEGTVLELSTVPQKFSSAQTSLQLSLFSSYPFDVTCVDVLP